MNNSTDNTYKGYTLTEKNDRMKYVEISKDGNYMFKAASVTAAQKLIDIMENIPKPNNNNKKKRPQPKSGDQKSEDTKTEGNTPKDAKTEGNTPKNSKTAENTPKGARSV